MLKEVSFKLAKQLKEIGFNTIIDEAIYASRFIKDSKTQAFMYYYCEKGTNDNVRLNEAKTNSNLFFALESTYTGKDMSDNSLEFFLAPKLEEVKMWLIKEHKLYVMITPINAGYYTYVVMDVQCDLYNEIKRCRKAVMNGADYNTHDEALEAGLLEACNEHI